jgi:NADH-quinone oxidoreductase subunit J
MIPFYLIAVVILVSAVMVVRSHDLVRAVLWLALVLGATAVAFILLHADILAVIQVMLYTGGIITLMLFAVLLTWSRDQGKPTAGRHRQALGLLLSSCVAAIFFAAIKRTELPEATPLTESDSQAVGALFLQQHVLAFEALSVLLLAAMIGAIVLARRRDA